MINVCSTLGSWRRAVSQCSSSARRSGVVNASKVSPSTRDSAVANDAKASVISSRVEHMTECYVQAPTTMLAQSLLKPQ
ncbi:Conserved protein of unknown function [Mycobacterium canettii CIPT 140060008]|nr:hypothetical protein FJ05194_2803 [Mycobacterium tuberculosis FJ05194]CCK51052.1 Conserved protein of unknown function [Mycobacterium canettii CIPT 140060008]CCK63260.1 Conserved protein of unknown function [Mycobacterium canettii CIPT 140070017]SIP68058.1 conserved hypothetical protein [Mycobacterium tuberculosis]